MTHILIRFFERRGTEGDVFVEAGCWKGASTAKFSLLCAINNYKLHVFDSFEGVEQTDDELSYFGGQYAAPERLVRENVEEYGSIEVVTFHKGWFKDTFRDPEIDGKIGAVYIDCDLKTGTMEVLDGIKNRLADNALIFSQDYHIPPIRRLLNDRLYWEGLGIRVRKSHLTKKLALFRKV
jgi:O-methyltransferase